RFYHESDQAHSSSLPQYYVHWLLLTRSRPLARSPRDLWLRHIPFAVSQTAQVFVTTAKMHFFYAKGVAFDSLPPSARTRSYIALLPGIILLPHIFLSHFLCASGSHRLRPVLRLFDFESPEFIN
ncbi:MAG TPA: hypothetical protein VMO20_08045, partial [Candidatus Acidoferrum sp.]|nr:hypothetical protein [Candidatus Acidoferrum sp.]